MYVYTQTIPVEDYFNATKTIVVKYKKIPTSETVTKNWLVFSYIRSENYELNHSFDNI